MQLAFFYIVLIALQGVLGTLFAPPDLFLLAALSFLWRLPPWRAVALAYGIGLVQDVLGFGSLGFHALALAAAVLLASIVAEQLNQSGIIARLVVVFSALLAKWLIFAVLIAWMTNREPFVQILRVAPLDIILTMLFSLLVLPFAQWLMERNGVLKRELL